MESRSFSSKGVQQEDVWSAADSLIADGLRPTIERVRQRIGRGSPNTVSPMLETWFATLATRLGVNKQEDASGNVPKELQQALTATWEIALSKSREASALEIVQAQHSLAQATQALKEREAELVQLEQVRAAKRQALEEAVNLARNSTEDALARLSEAQRLASRYETEIQNLQRRLADVETAQNAERRRNQEATADELRERQKIEERTQATQHRLLEEIDRARQETKKIYSEAQTVGKQFAAEKMLLEEKIRIHEKDQAIAQTQFLTQSVDFHALKEAFAVSNSRSQEVEALLTAQLDDRKFTIARLTEALIKRETGPVAGPRFLATKFKKISRAIPKR